MVLIVDEQRPPRRVHADELARPIGSQLDAALALGAEADRLAVLEADLVLRLLLDRVEGAVVVDVAVLVDLEQCRPLVRGRAAQDLRQVLLVGVDRARDEGRLAPSAIETGLNG